MKGACKHRRFKRAKRGIQKKTNKIFVNIWYKKDFTIVSLNESFFFFDCLARREWINENKRPVVRTTGSHKHSCLFVAMNLDGKQLFRQCDIFNIDTFLDFLKVIHSKPPRCYLFMDKASIASLQVKEGKIILNKTRTLIPVYLPTASPEFMILQEVWNIAKRDLLLLKHYPSFTDSKQNMSQYFRTKRFGLHMKNYLLWTV